jgi:GntR family transcriptional regulator/MocR family aminotransferase
LKSEAGDYLEVGEAAAGMHLLCLLPEGVDDVEAARAAAAHGVEAQPLSSFHLRRPARPGLVLGYAAYDEREIRDGVRRLSAALRSVVGVKNVAAKRRG